MAGITDLFKTKGKEMSDTLKEQGETTAKTYMDEFSKKLPDMFSSKSVSKPKVTPSGNIKVSPVTTPSSTSIAKKGKGKDLFKSKGGFVMYGIIAGIGFFAWKFLFKRKK